MEIQKSMDFKIGPIIYANGDTQNKRWSILLHQDYLYVWTKDEGSKIKLQELEELIAELRKMQKEKMIKELVKY